MRRINLVIAVLGLLVACSSKDNQGGAPTTEPTPAAQQQAPTAPVAAPAAPAPPAPAEPAKPDAEGIVRMTANDQMRFNTTRIEVPAGKIKIELKNTGALPKEVMGHNFIVLKPGSDPMGFAAKAMAAKATEYVPAGAAEVLGHTKQLGPGESAILELEVAAGTYPFLCSFPGHVGLMSGQLVAQ